MVRRHAKQKNVVMKLLLGFALLGIGLYAIYDYLGINSEFVHDQGTIVDYSKHVRRTGRRGGRTATILPRIKFFPRGADKPIIAQSKTETVNSYSEGDEVEILYDPNRPEKTMRVKPKWPVPDLVIGFIGLLVLLNIAKNAYLSARKELS